MRYWVVSAERKVEGPFEIEEITRRAGASVLPGEPIPPTLITRESLVCPEGGAAWVAAGEEFPLLFGAAPPPPPIGLAEPARPAPPPRPVYTPQPAVAPPGDDLATKVLLPVSVDPVCLLAGYLGLLSPLMIFAPFAIAFGIWGLVRLRNDPTQRGHVRAAIGIASGFIFSLVMVGVAISAALS